MTKHETPSPMASLMARVRELRRLARFEWDAEKRRRLVAERDQCWIEIGKLRRGKR